MFYCHLYCNKLSVAVSFSCIPNKIRLQVKFKQKQNNVLIKTAQCIGTKNTLKRISYDILGMLTPSSVAGVQLIMWGENMIA